MTNEVRTSVRTRTAPSPTGDPHVGTAHNALFNYVFAKKNSGQFLLRVEDTDQARKRPDSEQIMASIKWLGLTWDEGPDVGGPFGPYRQSERTSIYRDHISILLNKGTAYPCFCTAERLESLRQKQRQSGAQTRYDGHCREMSASEVAAKQRDGRPYVVRLKMPEDGQTVFHDTFRGSIEFDNAQIDDQVLLKSDGFPTYHLANVVDDYLMKISHVIRAEEWINSTPKHVQLYSAFGWQQPKWVHMPLLRNTDKSKISKRKNPTSIFYYKRAGILPEALVNFLALMGWSLGDDVEKFTLEQMLKAFDLKDVNIGGPVFDRKKLSWLNQQYMMEMDSDRFVDYLRNQIFDPKYLKALKPLVIERMERFEQFMDKNSFFFNGALNYQDLTIVPKSKDKHQMRAAFKELVEQLDDVYEWHKEKLEQVLNQHMEKIAFKPKEYFMPLRLVVTGRKDSPPLVESMEVLGREMVRFRIRDAMDFLK
jgi:glutamyl-tRNA synthetase